MDNELEKEQAFFMRQSQEMQPFYSRTVTVNDSATTISGTRD